ncbi:nitrogen regulation protein NIFR3 [Staphylococcus aureus]|nr:nitrogen regulation protein NIFR3 [Staphylococcus aureus]
MSQPLRKLHTYSTYLSFTLISRKLFNATKIVAPISERIAIQRVSQPGITNSKAIILIPMANVMFALMIFSVFLLSLTANGSLLKSSPINAISAVSMAVTQKLTYSQLTTMCRLGWLRRHPRKGPVIKNSIYRILQ